MNDDADHPGGIDLGRVWTGIAAEVWRRDPGPVERLAVRLLRSPGLARALLTTPSLLLPWLMSTVVIFSVGAVISLGGGEPLVWVLAPGIAAVAIAYAYGPGFDPAWELASSMPVSDRMVLLVRAVTVFAVNAAIGLAVSGLSYLLTAPATPGTGLGHAAGRDTAAMTAAITFGWLIPMAAVCLLTLAAAVITRSAGVGALTGVLAWSASVLASRLSTGAFSAAVTDSRTYLPYLAVAACAMAAIGYSTRPQRRTSQ
ncbi:MAG TPA: hypothetical protein VMG38_09920 [Trebonia sp.]|nr:hypothetical protein [Trebonia sp.]